MLSGSETAITSIPIQKVHQLEENRKNKRIKRDKENIEKTIGGILVGNNFVNILMASVATLIFVRRFGESAGSALATVFTTIIVLIFGDITPKTLATKRELSTSHTFQTPLKRVGSPKLPQESFSNRLLLRPVMGSTIGGSAVPDHSFQQRESYEGIS